MPEVALVPDQPPLAVQAVAFVVVQVSVVPAPDTTLVGLAFKSTVAAGIDATTATVTARFTVSPALEVQLKLNVLLAVNGPTACEPDTALLPDHAPLAVQVAALVELQVKVDEPCAATLVGLACKLNVGCVWPLAGNLKKKTFSSLALTNTTPCTAGT